jgi:propanol-preferring alcohol dehydrogenase
MFNRQACLTSEKHPLEIKKSLLSDRLPPRACLIQVQACGLCHTDLHLQDNGYILGTDVDGKQQILRFTERGVSYPLTPGHEIVGKVYQLGAAVDPCTARVGDTVLVYPWIGCGTCDRCLAGNENLCDRNEAKDIGFDIPGGFADFVLVPDAKYLIRLNSQEIANPSLLAVLACSGITSMAALKAAQKVQPKYLGIVGCGGLGMMAVQLASILLPETTIICVDIDDSKLTAARKGGAHYVFNSKNLQVADAIKGVCYHGNGADCMIDFVGSSTTFQLCLNSLRKHGKIVSVGLMGGSYNLLLPLLPLQALQIEGVLTGSFAELMELVQLVQTKRLNLEHVVTKVFKLEEINRAFDELRSGQIIGRCIIVP